MENCRRSVLSLCLIVFFAAFSMPGYAETVEEKKAAANYDEALPTPEEIQARQEASAPAGVKAAIATSVVPAQLVPAFSSATKETAGKEKTGSSDLPEDQVIGAPQVSGLVEISGYKYPVYLFAPKDYKLDRTYSMIMIAPAEDIKAEQQIEYLTGLAQRKSIFILAPYVLWPKIGDTPYNLDQWLLTVKNDVMERFPISKKRVYLVGKGSGAHYAAYMATKYPKEFAAVALIGEAWDGPFSQLVVPHSGASEQVPFYIALKADGTAKARNQAWFDKFQEKGYPLHLVDYKTDEELTQLDFKKAAFDWMESAAQNWETAVAQSQQGWKGKFQKGVKDFFAV